VICLVGSKALMLGTVNSPTLATPQKQTVMQAKTAASSGSSMFSCDLEKGYNVWHERVVLGAFGRGRGEPSCSLYGGF